MKIVIVEDEKTSLKLAHLVLSFEGHAVRDAEEATRALELIRAEKPDVLVTDLALPQVDGLMLTRRLKADPRTRDIPIVAITQYPDRYTEEQARRAGCDAYIVKPIDTRQFAGEVDKVAVKAKEGSRKGEAGVRDR